MVLAKKIDVYYATASIFQQEPCVIHFWNCFLNQNNMCLVLCPYSKLFEKPMIITPPYFFLADNTYPTAECLYIEKAYISETIVITR